MSTPTATKEHPTPFKGDMVRAIQRLDKTQTRRVIGRFNTLFDGRGRCSQAIWDQLDFSDAVVDNGPSPAGNDGPYLKVTRNWDGGPTRHRLYPKWRVGDKLWVRETWRPVTSLHAPPCVQYQADGVSWTPEEGSPGFGKIHLVKSLDGEHFWDENDAFCYSPKYRPPMFMPRWASRILLEVVDVRVERVQDISGHDCCAEGLQLRGINDGPSRSGNIWKRHIKGFKLLWDSINAKRGYGWDVNPWVFPVTFKKLETSHGD